MNGPRTFGRAGQAWGAAFFAAGLTGALAACDGGAADSSVAATAGNATTGTASGSATSGTASGAATSGTASGVATSGTASAGATSGATASSGSTAGNASGAAGGAATDGGQGYDATTGASSGTASGATADAGQCDACASGAIYVSPNGSDDNPGTLARPVRTLSKVQSLVRALNGSMTSDITVYLRGGTYAQTGTLAFSNADSGQSACGSSGCYVKYMAYPGERPLISGGQRITGWKLYDASKNVYSASALSSPFRQLYVNGVKAVRARSPNVGANGGPNFYRISGNDNTAHTIQVSSSYVANWSNFTKVEMHVMIGWGDATLRLASASTTGNTSTLKVQSAEDAIVFVRPNPALGGQFGGGTKHAFYFENALEMLDQAGEWYLDETANVVYYMPRTGEDMTTATVVAPMVETVVSINGASTSSQAGYLWFQGLTFAHATYLRPSDYGFIDGQAGQFNLTAMANNDQTVGRPSAGVSVTNANHIHFERNMFSEMAATGLDFVSGTHDDTVIGNVVRDVGGSGISVGKFTASDTTEYHTAYNPADTAEICTNDVVKDNYIANVTTEIQGGCGIACGYPRMIDIEHNEVANTNYTGISVGFGWTSVANAMQSNRINYNDVHNVVQVLADGASIYTLSNQQPASQMLNNYVHDYSTSQWADYGDNGLYMDEQTSGYTVEHNAMVNCPTNVVQNKNGANTVQDNGSNPSGAQATIAAAGIEPAYADIKNMTMPPY